MAELGEKEYQMYVDFLKDNKPQNAGLYLMVSARMGYLKAQAELGYKYLHGIMFPKNYDHAMQWLSEAAVKGDMDSVVSLATMYMYGYGTKTDGAKAQELLRKAVEAEYPAAGRFMGLCCEKGIGQEKNAAKAAEWYAWGAEKGDAGSMYLLADCFEHGTGMAASRDEARRWYEACAATDTDEAAMAKEALARL